MNVSLTPELERYARSKVESGRYNSVSEVVREALRLSQKEDAKLAHLQGLIAEGMQSPVASVTREDVKDQMRERMAQLRGEVARGERSAPAGESAATS